MTDRMVKPCIDCGNTVVVDRPRRVERERQPDDELARFRGFEISDEVWQRIVGGPVQCTDCVDRADIAEERRRQEERQHAAFLRRAAESGIPSQFHDIPLADLIVDDNNRRAMALATEWAQGRLRGLLLGGDYGVGKTCLAATAAWVRLKRESVRWYSVPTLIARTLGGFDSDDRRRAVEDLTGQGTLVLDDIDKVKATEWAATQLFTAIDARYNDRGSILLTTNMDGEELAESFGSAIADRLLHGRDRGFAAARINGESRRM